MIEVSEIVDDILKELHRAEIHGVEFNSAHEAYGVIKEELDEFWDLVKMKKKNRDPSKLYEELVQQAAMCIKAIRSIHNMVGDDV